MTPLSQLEKDARDRRMQFAATLGDLRSRLTLPGLADEALGLLDPHFTRLPPVYAAVKRHPLIAASAIAGASWLLKQALQKTARVRKNGKIPTRGLTRKHHIINSTTEKEHFNEIE